MSDAQGNLNAGGGAAPLSFTVPVNIVQNVDQTVIAITEDRLRLNTREFKDCNEFRSTWLTPASVLATIILTMVTADFKQSTFGLSAAIWSAVYIIVAIGCAFWLAVIVIRISRDKRDPSIDGFIARCKPRTPSALKT